MTGRHAAPRQRRRRPPPAEPFEWWLIWAVVPPNLALAAWIVLH